MIYFIRDKLTGLVKIGTAEDPWRRFSKIQSDCPGELEMLAIEGGGETREAELHATFADCWVRGEWFRALPDLMAHVGALGEPVKPNARGARTRPFWGDMCDAEVARATGFSRPYIHTVRTGRHRPSPAKAIKLQRVTGKSAVELVFGELASEAA